MKSNILIPKKINVGYQNRSGTYTGKLAYVIYYDEKGKLRKENSWQNWRDSSIPNEEFDNIPTEGFVLNKKVGDYDSGWNHRHAYCRVYDPRNFEFEISIENLLYILENTNSIKGKGLEGEFVYGWDGTDLVLIPIEAPDYKEIQKYNASVFSNKKIRARDLIIGATYLTKDNEEYIYIGKYDLYVYGYEWYENGELKKDRSSKNIPKDFYDYKYVKNFNGGKHFYFARKTDSGDYKFCTFKSIPSGKLIECLNDKCVENYADIFYKLEGEDDYSPYDPSKDIFAEISLDDFVNKSKYNDGSYRCGVCFISKIDSELKMYRAYRTGRDSSNKFILEEEKRTLHNNYRYYKCYVPNNEYFPTETVEITKRIGWRTEIVKEQKMIPVTIEEIYKVMKPLFRNKFLANGREYEKVGYLNE